MNTSTATLDELAHRPSTRKVPRRRSSGLKFFASSSTSKPQSASSSHKKWEADYLKDLRVNRPARPGGSRPFPGRTAPSTAEPLARASSALSFRPSCSTQQADLSRSPNYERSASALSHRRAQSDMPVAEAALGQPSVGVALRDFSTPTIPRAPRTTPSGTYRESGMRWMEKQEARSLREALEDMDSRDEAKVNAAAQDEASELVWKYRNEGIPQKSQGRLHSWRGDIEKGAHARSQSVGCHVEDGAVRGDHATSHQSISETSKSSKGDTSPSKTTRNRVITFAEPEPREERQPWQDTGHESWDSPQKKAYMNLNTGKLPKILGHRRSSAPRARDGSGGLFRNPGDKIYEEPDADKKKYEPVPSVPSDQSRIPAPLVLKNRNAVSKDRFESKTFSSRVASADDKIRFFRSEIHRNPPSQSRNPSYMENPTVSTTPGQGIANHTDIQADIPVIRGDKEIRGDDIRAATSMRMKDRSPKLPSPTVVSNRPGRPIVSFEHDWEPKNATEEFCAVDRPLGIPGRLRFKPHMPTSTASAPIVPTINVSNPPSIQGDEFPPSNSPSVPSISVSEAQIPAISIPEDSPTPRSLPTPPSKSRPLPTKRPFPHHSSTTPVHSSKLHWTPASRRTTAQCAACALPIEGRIVSAASQRFHPHCFTCHHCAEPLECVAFYPEPDSARTARVERIETRLACNTHTLPDEKQGETAADDGDLSLRFYCHLDYHELYSPRCRSCKTPIESEVVVACGGSWHVGHFFCAECGDPFDAKTPFVERNGYAWCVGCHAGRFSGKCKGCRKPVIEGGVSALGSEWHVECFCCVVSSTNRRRR